MVINWYPGHMKKTRELIANNLKLVDVVVEVLDARIPISSRNPVMDSLVGSLPRVVILNKADLSDEKGIQAWSAYYRERGIEPVTFNALTGEGMGRILDAIKRAGAAHIQKLKAKGMQNINLRCMIVGIPNVGKSSVINKLVGKKSAKTGNKPGVTRGKQWIRIRNDIDLFDTPGILWPKIEDPETGFNLAITGAINDDILDVEEVALKLLEKLRIIYPDPLKTRYKLDTLEGTPLELLERIGAKRGCLRAGGVLDYEKVSNLVIDEYRKGLMGPMTLEWPGADSVTVDDHKESPEISEEL